LEWLYGFWLDELNQDSTEAIPFTLASYNAGLGHVKDARRLAEKYEKDPFRWDANVAEMILRKSKPEYYQDEVVKHGYCRGSEPYNYVKEISARYDQYSNALK
jgi:membrane-bound lytic murein transglycosylase F